MQAEIQNSNTEELNLKKILVSGKNGQLGKELQDVSVADTNHELIFFNRDELNIADEAALKNAFEKHQPLFFINCAAYTAVDKAETEQQQAHIINAEAVGNIAKQCHQFNTKLIHISTDYVFDGKGTSPYNPDDKTDPVNYYGYTKWLGEQLAINNNPTTIIIRTSWVYSKYGNNFVKTMLRLMKERKEINVVSDQLGSPTYAKDLAKAIVKIVNSEWLMVNEKSVNRESFNGNEETQNSKLKIQNPVFHFSNEGIISWYDFAVAIRDNKQLDCTVNPIPTSAYPTPAKRPSYSGMNKTKIANEFHLQLKNWKDSLDECLRYL